MSDQTTSIFGSTQDSSAPQTQQNGGTSNVTNAQNNNGFADLLSEIKNERGEPKYKDLGDALNGLKHAQDYIPTLKSELSQKDAEIARLRAEAERVKTLEETLAALTSQQQQAQSTTQPVVDEKVIADLVSRTLSAKEQEAKAKANIQSVVATLKETFGSEAENKFYGKAEELGMTKQEINALAMRSPQAVLTMLGVNPQAANNKQNNISPTTSTVNTSALQPQATSFIGRNSKPALIGATSDDVREASMRAKKMVEELHAQGKQVHDLTDPKVYFKLFK